MRTHICEICINARYSGVGIRGVQANAGEMKLNG